MKKVCTVFSLSVAFLAPWFEFFQETRWAQKMLWCFVAVFFGTMVLGFFLARRIISQAFVGPLVLAFAVAGFLRKIPKDLRRVVSWFKLPVSLSLSIVVTYALWDETYRFAKMPSPWRWLSGLWMAAIICCAFLAPSYISPSPSRSSVK